MMMMMSTNIRKQEPFDHSGGYRVDLSGQGPPIRFGHRVSPLLAEEKMILKDEIGVKTTLKGNYEENWTERRFVKENLISLTPRRGKSAIKVAMTKKPFIK